MIGILWLVAHGFTLALTQENEIGARVGCGLIPCPFLSSSVLDSNVNGSECISFGYQDLTVSSIGLCERLVTKSRAPMCFMFSLVISNLVRCVSLEFSM